MAISAIVIAGPRRSDMGDIAALAQSIQLVGLLHPVVVDMEGRLVAGTRRLAACSSLGWDQVPVTIARNVTDAAAALIAERDENTCRKEMMFSELLPLKVALEALERPKAVARRTTTQGRPKKTGSKLEPVLAPPSRKTRNVVAKGLGKGATTMDKVAKVHDIAHDPSTPEPIRKVAQAAVVEMDRSGRVEPNYQAVLIAEQEHAAGEYLGADNDFDRLRLQETAFRLLAQLRDGLLALDCDLLAQACDEECWESLARMADRSAEWFAQVLAQRVHGLQIVTGGKK